MEHQINYSKRLKLGKHKSHQATTKLQKHNTGENTRMTGIIAHPMRPRGPCIKHYELLSVHCAWRCPISRHFR